MTIRELVVKIVMDADGFKQGAVQVDDTLKKTGDEAKGVDKQLTELQKSFHQAVAKGKKIDEVTEEYKRMRAEMLKSGSSAQALRDLDKAAQELGVDLKEAAQEDGVLHFVLCNLAAVGTAMVGVAPIKRAIAAYMGATQQIKTFSNRRGMSV